MADLQKFLWGRTGVFLMATLACLLWGSAFPAVKYGYALLDIEAGETASQIVYAGWRFALAGALLLFVAAVTGQKPLLPRRWQLPQVFILGLFQTAIQYALFYIGVAHTTGARSSIMNSTGVFFSVILAHFIYKSDRLDAGRVLGCIAGFIGVAVVNLDGGLDSHFSLRGEGFIALAAFMLAASSILGKHLSRAMNAAVMTGWQLLIGGVILTVAGHLLGGEVGSWTTEAALLLAYLVMISSVSFSVWGFLLKHHPVGMIAPFKFLIPVFGILISALLLSEEVLRPTYFFALLLVCVGVWLVTRTRGRIISETG
ncbi:DMT family transporter [Sphingomonas sp. AP4-R1]|uniref:DMT family transporter n=1 Tax=Sphingomonas sp. AP4-R1 TaxID=2735134 RepID=UPI001493720D|nr:DMT family transporter [Sphingomonas sp. AP4-R1]QJU58165.1 DMT family transporter [Sphingomonas sp. AP4-R1]